MWWGGVVGAVMMVLGVVALVPFVVAEGGCGSEDQAAIDACGHARWGADTSAVVFIAGACVIVACFVASVWVGRKER